MKKYTLRQDSVSNNDFFILRTPLLPFDEFQIWSTDLSSALSFSQGTDEAKLREQWLADASLLRERLVRILKRPEVRHAISVASPSLDYGIEEWLQNNKSKRGIQAERSIVRYFQRMSSRPTPFGLFAGCSIGAIPALNTQTVLQIAPREEYRTVTRLDSDYLFALAGHWRRDPRLRDEMQYELNNSLYKVGNDWHYIESRVKDGKRFHYSVKVEDNEYLRQIIESSHEKAVRFGDLVNVVSKNANDASLPIAACESFVQDLIDSEILVSTLIPTVSDISALDSIHAILKTLPSATTEYEILSSVRAKLSALDKKPIGARANDYEEVVALLDTLEVPVDRAKLFQVDMFKPATDLRLSQPLVTSLRDALEVVCCLGTPIKTQAISDFIANFAARYDQAWIPLTQALDEEAGIGFASPEAVPDSSIIKGLQLGTTAAQDQVPFTAFHATLLRKLFGNTGTQTELELTREDLPMRANPYEVLPESFSLFVTLIPSGPDSSHDGYRFLLSGGGSGPSAARMLARFCHGDPELLEKVKEMLDREERMVPDAIFAEIVHLPEGRLGNVISRPPFRKYEIPYLGRSLVPIEHQIGVEDLWVTVRDKEILLFSHSRQRQVIPRLSNAHGFHQTRFATVYRFLSELQNQDGAFVPRFKWGPLSSLNFLPRVRVGNVILSVAQWTLTSDEVDSLLTCDRYESYVCMQKIRHERHMPRWLSFEEADSNHLLVDLDNPLSVDAFLHILRRNPGGKLLEKITGANQLPITGPEGRFHHELLIPFWKTNGDNGRNRNRLADVPRSALEFTGHKTTRAIVPGAGWQYLKLYGSSISVDGVLTRQVPKLLGDLRSAGINARFFFLRYADPHRHLRIRFKVPMAVLSLSIKNLVEPLLDAGVLWKVQYDTYEREIERYGGVESLNLVEEIFCSDSEAALALLQQLEGDNGLDWRWKLSLLGIHQLFNDFFVTTNRRINILSGLELVFRSEFNSIDHNQRELGRQFRVQRRELEKLLNEDDGSELVLSAREIFAKRSSEIRPIIQKIHALEEANTLTAHVDNLMIGIIHMHVNRMIRSLPRAHEWVMYNFLWRFYTSKHALEL